MSRNYRFAKKRKPKKLKPRQLLLAILEVIGLTLISGGGTFVRPTLPIAVKAIIALLKEAKRLEVEEKKVKRVLDNLEKKEILNIEEKDNTLFVHILDKDNPTIIKYSIQALLDYKKKKKQWNGKWFLVFFDVPELQRNKRNYLRKFLVKLGFYRYQKSVYLFPYECEEEVKLIKRIVEGANYMKYIIAEKIEDEEEAKQFFSLGKITNKDAIVS